MHDAPDDTAPPRPTGSSRVADDTGSSDVRTPASNVGEPRKPRIEVLEVDPSPAPDRDFAGSATEPRIETIEGSRPLSRQMDRGPLSHAGPESPEPSKLTRDPLVRLPAKLLLAALLALLILGAAFVATFWGSDEVESSGRSESSDPPPEAIDSPPVVESIPPSGGAEQEWMAQAPPDRALPREERVQSSTPSEEPPARDDAGPQQEADVPAGSVEAASAVRTVRAFYSSLSDGDGGSAAQFVVPAKRQSGPLSAGALTRYYSSFRRPLRVLRASAVDADTVRVSYDYVLPDGRLCEGQAVVDLVQGAAEPLIGSIRTQGAC